MQNEEEACENDSHLLSPYERHLVSFSPAGPKTSSIRKKQ